MRQSAPHDWQMIQVDIVVWTCSRCRCICYGASRPSPHELVRTRILNDPDWMQELLCDEAIVKTVMSS